MSRKRIFDVVRGTEVPLALPPCRAAVLERPRDESLDSFLRLGERGEAIMERHQRMLNDLARRG